VRIQVMHLPGAGDDYPFAIVIDEAPSLDEDSAKALRAMKEDVGARAVLVFRETVEVV
jgi:hypothetical protein